MHGLGFQGSTEIHFPSDIMHRIERFFSISSDIKGDDFVQPVWNHTDDDIDLPMLREKFDILVVKVNRSLDPLACSRYLDDFRNVSAPQLPTKVGVGNKVCIEPVTPRETTERRK